MLYQSQAASGEWFGPVQVGVSEGSNTTHVARAPDGTLWVVWRDVDGTAIFYRYSLDGGRSWRIGDDGGVVAAERGNMIAPSIAVGPDNLLHVVWYIRSAGPSKGEIRFADWNGSRFNAGNITTDGGDAYDADPAIVVDRQNIQHGVWRKQAGENWVITYARRLPGGGWQDFTALATTSGDAKYAPALGTDELGDIFVTFSDPIGKRGRRIVMLYRLADGEWTALGLSGGPWDSRTAVVGSASNGFIQAHVLYQHEVGTDDGEIIYDRVTLAEAPAPPTPAPPPPPAAPAPPPPAAPAAPSAPSADALGPAQPRADCTYLAETKHNLCGAFRGYWRDFGGFPIYGNPISEEFVENGLTVQYFERARFEYHPGAQPRRYDVLLGWLGSESIAAHAPR